MCMCLNYIYNVTKINFFPLSLLFNDLLFLQGSGNRNKIGPTTSRKKKLPFDVSKSSN